MNSDFSAGYQFNDLIDLVTQMQNPSTCKEFLIYLRWDGQMVCPHCSNDGKIYRLKSNFKCARCKQPFSETKGTIFENSPIPLCKWFVAIWMITTNKKGVSSTQLARDLNVTQKTAWQMIDRIRKAFKLLKGKSISVTQTSNRRVNLKSSAKNNSLHIDMDYLNLMKEIVLVSKDAITN